MPHSKKEFPRLYLYSQWRKLAPLVDDEEGKADCIFIGGMLEQIALYIDAEGCK